MRLHRFYRLQPLGEDVVIDDVSTIKQWTKVLRYKVFDTVVLFNGDGSDYTYQLISLTKKEIVLHCLDKQKNTMPTKEVILCMAILKNSNFELVIQKAVELGVTTIIPILSERTEKKSINGERLLTIMCESAEQCGRGDVPELLETLTIPLALQEVKKRKVTSYVLDMEGSPLTKTPPSKSALWIGPEGGWGVLDKQSFAEASVTTCSLGATTLRAETAGIVGVFVFCSNF